MIPSKRYFELAKMSETVSDLHPPFLRPRHLLPLLERFPFFDGVLHLAGVAAVVSADDAVLRHPVDHAGRAAIADAERALKKRHAATAFTNYDLDGLLIDRKS